MPEEYHLGLGNSWGRDTQFPLFKDWPPNPTTARYGQPILRPVDTGLRGIGDVDCDMLADADEYGIARAPAKEEIRRRAAREHGIKAYYHEGFCIGVEYVDPRSDERKEGEKEDLANGLAPSSIEPDWTDPFEDVDWRYDPYLHDFESRLYGFGFEPYLRE